MLLLIGLLEFSVQWIQEIEKKKIFFHIVPNWKYPAPEIGHLNFSVWLL